MNPVTSWPKGLGFSCLYDRFSFLTGLKAWSFRGNGVKRYFLFSLGLIFLDQLSKYLAAKFAAVTINPGGLFGWGVGMSTWFYLAAFTLLVFDSVKRGVSFIDVLILSGGLSNIIDRAFRGGVIDWIRLMSVWFNGADLMITIGVSWIILRAGKTVMNQG